MTYIIQYRSNTIMPPDVTDILETAKSSLIELSREPDKATVLFDVMRKELINWLALHERFDDYYCRDCAEYKHEKCLHHAWCCKTVSCDDCVLRRQCDYAKTKSTEEKQ